MSRRPSCDNLNNSSKPRPSKAVQALVTRPRLPTPTTAPFITSLRFSTPRTKEAYAYDLRADGPDTTTRGSTVLLAEVLSLQGQPKCHVVG